MIAGHLALIAAAIFFGAAIYINIAEQKARLSLPDQPLLTEWKPSYKRGFAMQAPLAIGGFLLGLLAWRQTRNSLFLVGGFAMLANGLWTILAIQPVNRVLMATPTEHANTKTRVLIEKWGRLHAVRSALGFFATLAFLWACLSQ
jgi:Domain of unknown function (DUF1772)